MPAQAIIQITEDTFEHVLQAFNDTPIIDLREVSFIDPYGMVGILEIGELLKSNSIQKTIHLPMSEEVLKYLERMDFFKFAGEYFSLEPSAPYISEKYPDRGLSLFTDAAKHCTGDMFCRLCFWTVPIYGRSKAKS